MSEVEVDVGIIGAGPGGYHAAIRAEQLGARVALIEKNEIGGVCLNRGCIPTKALLESTKMLAKMERLERFGLSVDSFSARLRDMKVHMERTVKKLTAGLRGLLDSYEIKVVKGVGVPLSSKRIKVSREDGSVEYVRCENMIIATGSSPIKTFSKGEGSVITTDDVLRLDEPPRSILILGGDMIGLEFAYILNKLGTEVTVIEESSHILPFEDQEVALQLQRILMKDKIKVFTNAKILSFDVKDGEVTIVMEGLEKELSADKVLLTGRKPNIESLHLRDLGVKVEEGRILVNEYMETSIKGVYAIGDVTGGAFAHVASAEGVVAAENIMKKEAVMNHHVIPRCIYLTPEIACVGLTEEQARNQGYAVKVGKFPFAANGRALTLQEIEGFVKIIADAESGEILGVHIIGPRATELIAEVTLAMKFELTVEDLAETIHAHPTLSEAIKEAALTVCERSIHLPPA